MAAWNDYPIKSSVANEDTLMVNGKNRITVESLIDKAVFENGNGTNLTFSTDSEFSEYMDMEVETAIDGESEVFPQ